MTAFTPEQEARLAELIRAALAAQDRQQWVRKVLAAPVENDPFRTVLAWAIAMTATDRAGAEIGLANENLAALGYRPADRRAVLMALWPGELEAICRALAQTREAYLDQHRMTGEQRRRRLQCPPAGLGPPFTLEEVLNRIAPPRTAPIGAPGPGRAE